jgi:hypothetical protein
MSPWTIVEWVAALGVSVVLVVVVVFGITIGVRYLVSVTSGKFWVKKKTTSANSVVDKK